MSYSRPLIVINVCYLFVDLSVPSFTACAKVTTVVVMA